MTTTKKATTATKKSCFVLRRYEIKATGTICADIRTSEGKEYRSCLFADGRHSCTCKAGEKQQLCYHVKHLPQVEAQRNITIESSSAQQEVQAQCAETGEKASVSAPVAPDTLDYRQGRPTVAVARQVSSVEASAPAWLMRGFASNGWMSSR